MTNTNHLPVLPVTTITAYGIRAINRLRNVPQLLEQAGITMKPSMMTMKDLLYILLIIGIAAFSAGCTTNLETATPTVTPTPTETQAPTTPRPTASIDLPDFDYADVPVIFSGGDTDWLTTNASYVARIALSDGAARAMYLGGGEVEGVLLSCHPTPSQSSDNGCAPALRIANETAVVDLLVNETEGRVISTVTEIT